MNRDYQFEITYIISLIIAILGIVTTQGIKQFVDTRLAYLLLAILFFHIVVFNIFYTFENAISFSVSEVDTLKAMSKWTLLVTTFLFLFLVVHVIGFATSGILLPCGGNNGSFCSKANILMRYGVPLLFTGAAMYPLKDKIQFALLLRQIEVSIEPKRIRVFSRYNDTEPLFIKMVNNSGSEQEFEVTISLPPNIRAMMSKGSSGSDTISRKITIPSNRREVLDLELKYEGDENNADSLIVEIQHEHGRFEEEIELAMFG